MRLKPQRRSALLCQIRQARRLSDRALKLRGPGPKASELSGAPSQYKRSAIRSFAAAGRPDEAVALIVHAKCERKTVDERF